MNINFCYFQPVILQFGRGLHKRLNEIISEHNFKRGVLVCDKIFEENGMAGKLKNSTQAICAIYSDITQNPLLSEVERAASLMKEINADFAIALGGGSSLDLAKFACSLVFAQYKIQDYFFQRKIFENKSLPLIVLPTTAGTGSEVTPVSVCNDDESLEKRPLSHENFYPYMAIIDPLLTKTLPPFLTAVTGLDAMSHALEAFWSKNHQPICDLYAEKSLKLIFDNLEKAYDNGEDLVARENMSLGALYAGLAFAQAKTAGVHACSYPLSSQYGLCHGEACAITLDLFLCENSKVDSRISDLAKKLGFKSVDNMAKRIREMKIKFKLNFSLSKLKREEIEKLAEETLLHPLFKNNPKTYTLEELTALFLAVKD